MNKSSLCSWSGGKDSCFALMQSIRDGYTPAVLLNVLNEEGKISPFAWHSFPDTAGAGGIGRFADSSHQQFMAGI
ncbi:MAG: hypothetical protein WDO19_16000 [Bacteroidota bacterium]